MSEVWRGGSGLFSDPSQWDGDAVPGTADTAVIVGPTTSTAYVVTGPGDVANLLLERNVALAGTISAGAVTLDADTVYLLAGAVLSAPTVGLGTGTLSVNGSTVDASGKFVASGMLGVAAGGMVQAASVTLDGTGWVDPTGTFEVGTAGGAAAGAITVDDGATLNGTGTLLAPVVDNGLITDLGKYDETNYVFSGAVSGTGVVQLGTDAELAGTNAIAGFAAAVGAGITVDLVATGHTVTIQEPGSFAATIAGFAVGDALAVNATGITGVAYGATGVSTGTLALLAGGATLATIDLSGDYAGDTFLVVPFGGATANAEIFLATNGPTTEAAAPVGNTDTLAWNSSTGGAWNTPSLWLDTFLDGPAAVAPGSMNPVTIDASTTGFQVITGDGNASSMAISGLLALAGKFNTGELTVNTSAGPGGIGIDTGVLDLLAGTTLTATTAGLEASLVVDGAGASLAVSGSLTLGFSESAIPWGISVVDGGAVRVGSLALADDSYPLPSISIDPTGTFEVGTAGGAAAGDLTVDAGATAALAGGQVDAPIVDDGTIIIGEGEPSTTTLTGAVSGTGTVQLTEGSSLVLDGPVAAGTTIAFVGGIEEGGGLNIASAGTVAASITGFSTMGLIFAAPEVDGVSYDAGSGALVLQDATGNPLQTLDMVGSFSGDSFLAVAGATDSEIVLAAGTLQSGPPPAPSPGTTTPDDYSWGTNGGAWGSASNWRDTTVGGTASVAPGANNIVTIAGGPSWQVVSGAGDAASLTVTGDVALSGSFAATQLTVGDTLLVSGAGAAMTVSSTVTLGAFEGTRLPFFAPGTLDVSGGASVRIGGLSVGNADGGAAGSIFIDSVSSIEIGTAGGAVTGALNVDAGSSVMAFSLNVFANVVNNGSFVIGHGGSLAISGNLSGTGVIELGAGAIAGFSASGGLVGAGQTVELIGGNTLDLLSSGTFAATVSGFAPGDLISFGAAVTGANWAAAGGGTGTLTLSDDGTTVATLTLAGNYAGDTFLVSPGPAQSSITLASIGVACFAEGTRILTDRGPVPVEALRVGDRVASAFGAIRPVRWIGRRRIDCRRHPSPHEVWPVRVRAHTFADGAPLDDLLLSPDHAIFADGALIPVRYLVNGATIVQEAVKEITYFHVELPVHDVLIAEGLRCESYLDTGNRAAFDNDAAMRALTCRRAA